MPPLTAPADLPFQLYDSVAQTLLPIELAKGSPLSFYACGVTPYAAPHLGHGRSFVVFDALARVLEAFGWPTTLVRNITDIDDKIIAAAQAQGTDWRTLAWGWADQNRRLLAYVGVRPTPEPKVSEHLDDIKALIARLVDLGHAYPTPIGDVYFDTTTFQGTDVAHQPAESLLSATGEGRVQKTAKRNAADFALWKAAKPGEPSWPSPWGEGRPGWHIECSAMAQAYFGTTLTLHGGGSDLRFPHHQCEVCQSEAAFGRPLARHWIHHGSVLHDGEKMSKSLGNVVALADALDEAERLAPGQGGAVLRWALLQRHWAKPLDWQPHLLPQAASQLQRLKEALHAAFTHRGMPDWAAFLTHADASDTPDPNGEAFWAALSDNFNVPGAVAVLFRTAQRAHQPGTDGWQAARLLGDALRLLGLDEALWPAAWRAPDRAIPDAIQALLTAREAARQARDYAQADRLRDLIQEEGWTIEDRPEGPQVSRAGV